VVKSGCARALLPGVGCYREDFGEAGIFGELSLTTKPSRYAVVAHALEPLGEVRAVCVAGVAALESRCAPHARLCPRGQTLLRSWISAVRGAGRAGVAGGAADEAGAGGRQEAAGADDEAAPPGSDDRGGGAGARRSGGAGACDSGAFAFRYCFCGALPTGAG
jgi:hypothetical protein